MSGPPDFSKASLLDLFRMEVEAHAAVLNEGLVSCADGTVAPETLAAMMRAAHSIKGAARTIALQDAVEVAHAMEDCFVRAQEGKQSLLAEHVDLLLRGTDYLAQAGTGDADAARHQAEDIVAAFQALKSGAGSAKEKKASKSAASSSVKLRTVAAAGAAKAADEKAPPGSAEGSRAVRVNAVSLNRLMGLAGEILIESGTLNRFEKPLRRLRDQQAQLADAVGRLREHAAVLADKGQTVSACLQEVQRCNGKLQELVAESIDSFGAFALRSDNLSHRLYREVLASRMRPFSDGLLGFPRMVHDLARSLGKKARLEVLGKATEVDRDILEKLDAPLTHLLRNAIDHGIESPAERAAAGKPEQGHIVLEATHKGGMLFISVADDGRGVDVERVREKVVERNLAPAEMAARMADHEVLEFLFLPGFSTAREVTELSGRGVGLDVVKTMVQEVAGQLRVTSRLGQGCTFQVQLPLTLSVITALLVEICGEPYAFPLARISRILKVAHADIQTLENRQFFRLDGQNIGLVPPRQVLDLARDPEQREEVCVVVIGERSEPYGLAVDRVLGEREIVVRPLDVRLGRVPNIGAAAIMEDGRPVLILDTEDMVYSIRALLKGGRLQRIAHGAAEQKAPRKRILVVDDSLTVREVERKFLENKGYAVEVATDGAEGWLALRSGTFDLVITDVDMPRMNGIEFVTAIRADAHFKTLPVMIVSYKDREEDRLRGMEAGADYYLTKSSFHDESLLGAVQDLIGEAQ